MQYTSNLNLRKPDYTDVIDIADLNANADALDEAVAGLQGELDNRYTKPEVDTLFDSIPDCVVISDTEPVDSDVWIDTSEDGGLALPEVTTADNGKFLRVVDGEWAVASVASAEGASF